MKWRTFKHVAADVAGVVWRALKDSWHDLLDTNVRCVDGSSVSLGIVLAAALLSLFPVLTSGSWRLVAAWVICFGLLLKLAHGWLSESVCGRLGQLKAEQTLVEELCIALSSRGHLTQAHKEELGLLQLRLRMLQTQVDRLQTNPWHLLQKRLFRRRASYLVVSGCRKQA
jgi:hypothetical protein